MKTSQLTNSLIERLASGQVELKTVLNCQRDWKALIKSRPIKGVQEAIRLDTPTLAALKNFRENGETYTIGLVCDLITEVCENMTIKGNMSEQQIGFAAQELINDYYFLRLSEIRFFLLEGLKGRYGKVYDRFDIAVMNEWLQIYDKQRMEEKQRIENQKKDTLNTEGAFLTNAPEEMKNEFYALLKRITPENKEVAASLIYGHCKKQGINIKDFLQGLQKRYDESDIKELYSFNEFIELELGTQKSITATL